VAFCNVNSCGTKVDEDCPPSVGKSRDACHPTPTKRIENDVTRQGVVRNVGAYCFNRDFCVVRVSCINCRPLSPCMYFRKERLRIERVFAANKPCNNEAIEFLGDS